MATTLDSLVRIGRVSEALQEFRNRTQERSPENGIRYAELLCLAGELEEAAFTASNVERQAGASLTKSLQARVAMVAAACCYDVGHDDRGIEHTSRALALAETARDSALSALAASQLLVRSAETPSKDRVLWAAQARRNALRAGDAQVSARVHANFGRVEGRAGNLSVAQRHLSIAREILRSDPNLWIGATIDLDAATVFGLLGELDLAVEMTHRAATDTEISGWRKGQAIASANLAYLYVMLGRFEEAIKHVSSAPGQFRDHPAIRKALAETFAQAEFCKMSFDAAERLLPPPETLEAFRVGWYDVSCYVTRTHILLAKRDWDHAKECAEAGLALAAQLRNGSAAVALKLCRAEALIGLGVSLREIDGLFSSNEHAHPEIVASSYAVAGLGLLQEGEMERGSTFIMRGMRTLERLGAPCRTRAELLKLEVSPVGEVSNAGLDSAVALLELAGHPHILGPEAFALIEASHCAHAAAVVTSGPGGTRIVTYAGWTEAQALAAAAASNNGTEHLPLGRRMDELWTLVVQPRRELAPFCTYAAIRKLLAVALSLDQYRRDEKQRAALWPADSLEGDQDCIWASEQMAETLSIARRIAPTPLSVLITGETGTGKEMLARVIHRASDRADRPFLPFNCTAVPREMLESQLFGYRKGAFTGAESSFPGVIRSAAGGTLFLDEIGEIGPEMQPKLLRFLETHEIHPLGEPHPIKVDVRVLAATNAGVEQMVANGKFREDLFYRLNVVRLALPPLRERREEIPPLVQHYLRKYSDEQRKGRLTLTDETLEYLLLFSWPGNVRQLANEVLRIVAMAEPDSAVTPADLSPDIQASRRTIPATTAPDVEARVALDQPLPVAVEMLEQLMVRRALDRTHGRVEEASRLLGISRKGLFLKRRRWGLSLGQAS